MLSVKSGKIIKCQRETYCQVNLQSGITAVNAPCLQWRRSWGGGVAGVLTPWKYVGVVEYVFTPPPINVTFFQSKLLLDNSASFTSQRMKDLCHKWKVKLFFRNSLMAWPDWPRAMIFYDISLPVAVYACRVNSCELLSAVSCLCTL